MTLGPFGRAYERSLRNAKPHFYRKLQVQGALDAHLAEVDAVAQFEFESIYAALQRQNPAPEASLERMQHNLFVASQAQEVVLDAILIRDDEPEPRPRAAARSK